MVGLETAKWSDNSPADIGRLRSSCSTRRRVGSERALNTLFTSLYLANHRTIVKRQFRTASRLGAVLFTRWFCETGCSAAWRRGGPARTRRILHRGVRRIFPRPLLRVVGPSTSSKREARSSTTQRFPSSLSG